MVRPPEVTRRTQIPKDDAEWFDATYPMYGAWTWFIGACLAAFRARHTVDIGPTHLADAAADDVYREGEDD